MHLTAIIVFAKAPEPGTVKTRLAPLLGMAGAADLHARLVEHALLTALAAGVGPVELSCAPDPAHPFFQECAARYRVTLAAQGAGNLGDRLFEACSRSLERSPAVLVIGADCPALTPRHLLEASRALAEGCEAAIAPAEDGGYVLIGLTRCDTRLFAGVSWGGPSVMEETRARLATLGWTWRTLETLWDVDRPEDYERLLGSGLLAALPAR